jgi:hypothetical protein
MADDMEKVYDEKIDPLMKQIIALCKEHKIPIIACFQLDFTDDPLFCTTYITQPGMSSKFKAARLELGPNSVSTLMTMTITKKPSE